MCALGISSPKNTVQYFKEDYISEVQLFLNYFFCLGIASIIDNVINLYRSDSQDTVILNTGRQDDLYLKTRSFVSFTNLCNAEFMYFINNCRNGIVDLLFCGLRTRIRINSILSRV